MTIRYIDNDTFIIEGEDLVYKVRVDSEPASGDGWDEPRSPAHAWIHELWYATVPTFEETRNIYDSNGSFVRRYIVTQTDGDGWVEMNPRALKKGLLEFIEDECNAFAFPEREDA